MVSASTPLIARLRRRLRACVGLFAFLVMAKAVLATSCLIDGATEAVAGSRAASATLLLSATDSGDDGACWHDGAAGCHCACAHGVALPSAAHAVVPVPALRAIPVTLPLRFVSSSPGSLLRPPIA